MNKVRAFIQNFDLYGQPVALLNIRGITKFTTTCGGLVGMVIIGLILWFFETRLTKLVTKDDAVLSEVNQGLNLLAADSPEFKFSENSFIVGAGIFAIKNNEVCPEGSSGP